MILGRERILRLVEKDKLIEDFSSGCLGGAGYDLRVNKLYLMSCGGFLGESGRKTPDVKEIEFKKFVLKPGDYVLAETLEKVNMPSDVAARILPRSSLFRCGCSLTTAFVDPGYRGVLIMGLTNLSKFDFTLEKGARIAQVLFESVDGETTPYEGRYQGGKVV